MSHSQTKKELKDKKLEIDRENDPFALLERAADIIWDQSKTTIEKGKSYQVSDEAITKIMTASVKLYAAKAELENRSFRPLLGNYDEIVSPTEALTSVTEILRALKLGPMEFGLWSRKKPEDYHNTED